MKDRVELYLVDEKVAVNIGVIGIIVLEIESKTVIRKDITPELKFIIPGHKQWGQIFQAHLENTIFHGSVIKKSSQRRPARQVAESIDKITC